MRSSRSSIPISLEISHTRLYSTTFFLMAVANFMVLCSFSTFFLFPVFILDRRGNELDIGVLMGAFTLSSVLCRPWISEMIDRLGRKRSYTIGSFSMCALPFVYLAFQGELVDFYYLLLVVRILHGMGFAVCLTAAFTYIADIIPASRLNEGFGIFGVSGIAGTAAGPMIAEFAVNRYGFPELFMLAGFLGGLAVVCHLPVRETLVHKVVKARADSFLALFKQERLIIVSVVAVLFGFGLASSNNFVVPFAVERHVEFVSLYYLSYSGAAIVTRFIGGGLADRTGEKKIVPLASLMTGSGLASLIFLSSPLTLVISGAMTGCGHGFLYPCLNALALRGEPIETRGKITGLFTGSIDSGVFAGSLIFGVIAESFGFPCLFILSGAALFGAFGLFQWYREKI